MPRLFRRHVVLPTDHGAWAFLLSPLIVGLAAGGTWRLTSTYLVVAALCAFLVRQPVTRAIKAWSGRTKGTDLGTALLWIAIYATVGLLHVFGLVMHGQGHVLWLAVPGAPVFAWYLWLVWHKAERRQQLVELVGAGVLALSAPAALWVAHGRYQHEGWTLFALAWGHTACMILLAYVRLTQKTWSEVPPRAARLRVARAPLLLAGFELVLVGLGAATDVVPLALLLPHAFQAFVVTYDAFVPAAGWRPKRIGLRLLAATTIFTLLFALAWGSFTAAR